MLHENIVGQTTTGTTGNNSLQTRSQRIVDVWFYISWPAFENDVTAGTASRWMALLYLPYRTDSSVFDLDIWCCTRIKMKSRGSVAFRARQLPPTQTPPVFYARSEMSPAISFFRLVFTAACRLVHLTCHRSVWQALRRWRTFVLVRTLFIREVYCSLVLPEWSLFVSGCVSGRSSVLVIIG